MESKHKSAIFQFLPIIALLICLIASINARAGDYVESFVSRYAVSSLMQEAQLEFIKGEKADQFVDRERGIKIIISKKEFVPHIRSKLRIVYGTDEKVDSKVKISMWEGFFSNALTIEIKELIFQFFDSNDEVKVWDKNGKLFFESSAELFHSRYSESELAKNKESHPDFKSL